MGIVQSVNLSMLLPKSPMLNRYCNETLAPSTMPLPQSPLFASASTRHVPQIPAPFRQIDGMPHPPNEYQAVRRAAPSLAAGVAGFLRKAYALRLKSYNVIVARFQHLGRGK